MVPRTILVVDTDPVFRGSLTDILNRAGYNAHAAADNRSAISVAKSLGTEIDLLVVSMALPDVKGDVLVKTIAINQKKIIKVIASTSVFSEFDLASRDTFEHDAAITKESGDAAPANAAKWLLTVRGLLGEQVDSASEPSLCIILLADDNHAVRRLTKDILHRVGYQVLEADDGGSALALARKIGGNVDLLITDVRMPRMDGPALAKAFRKAYYAVPVLYTSGFTEGLEAKDLNDSEQGFAFLEKPFPASVLLETVSRMLKQPATSLTFTA